MSAQTEATVSQRPVLIQVCNAVPECNVSQSVMCHGIKYLLNLN